MYSGRDLDISAKTHLTTNPLHFDNAKGNFRNIASVKNKLILRARIEKLKVYVSENLNESYMEGEVIDKQWLSLTVANFFNRPSQEKNKAIDKQFVYFHDFCLWWCNQKASTWRTSSNDFLTHKRQKEYARLAYFFGEFEVKNNKKHKIKEVGDTEIYLFADFLESLNYSSGTIKRLVARIKFFTKRAKEQGLKIDPSVATRFFIKDKNDDAVVPYLSESEIDRLFKIDLSNNDFLENIRDNAIIGCWTGLRISDFNHNLDLNNIEGDFIRIKTKKTKSWVVIPLHPQVKSVIKKRYGLLPDKISDKAFNKGIKEICKMVGINEQIKGGVMQMDHVTRDKRKVIGIHPKYELISAHTLRRSFATNLHGKVPNSVIISCAGWSSEKMMLNYIKKTKKEHAETLKAYWDSHYKT